MTATISQTASPLTSNTDNLDDAIRTSEILKIRLQRVYRRTDRLLAVVLMVEWLVAIVTAILISPGSWSSETSYGYTHLTYALFLGAAICALPVYLAIAHSGTVLSRNVIAIAQMLMSALLIHLTGGRIETHFHIFGSLAIISFYRDWRVLLSATAVVAIHLLCLGTMLPGSVFGDTVAGPWLWVEHVGWVAFEDFFLILSCRQNVQEMQEAATQQAKVEGSNVATKMLLQKVIHAQDRVAQEKKIGEVVDVLSGLSDGILSTVKELSGNAQQALAAVAETTSIVEELRQTAESSSLKARKVSDDSQAVVLTSERGKISADDTVESMNRIRSQMKSISESMSQLRNQTRQIGEIITAVDELSQQSNLLSVNAAIEAAKAGEQGKGFAVVAREVKNLSEESKKATAQVRRILEDIEKAVRQATRATESGTGSVGEGEEVVSDARLTILSLAASLGRSAQASTEIDISSQQQLLGAQQVGDAMNSVKEATDHNLRSVQELEAALLHLNRLGQTLKSLVEEGRRTELNRL